MPLAPLPGTAAGDVAPGTWLLAVAPVVLLLTLVLWGRFSTTVNATLTVGVSVALAAGAFGADTPTVLVGLGKGAWVGVWILYVIWPALLMHQLAGRVGMTSLGNRLARLLPRRTENILLLAWILPSFIQGVSGFGTPIAVAAPLLAALGLGAALSVALPLVGYHWSVGFGSMGSSFYMGALTAHLDHAERAEYAATAALVLGGNCFVAGCLVALMADGRNGLRAGAPLIVVAGTAMAGVQALVARAEPGIATLCGGGAGVLAVFVWRASARRRIEARQAQVGDSQMPAGQVPGPAGQIPDAAGETRRARAAAVPYLLLAVIALAVFLPPASRAWTRSHLLLGPSFPATHTSAGIGNPAVTQYNPIAVAGHPGTFLLLACLGSLVVWRLTSGWPPSGGAQILRSWFRQARRASSSVLLLAALAGLLVDAGMVAAAATGTARATGHWYPAVAPVVGALGSFITGSTTSSNALFAALQADVARLIGDHPGDLLAGQLAGGNIGNSLAPVVILIGLSAVGAPDSTADVLRRTLPAAVVLLASAILTTCTVVLIHR